MSHLGERLTALVDGQLDDEAREHALAHIAGCAQCRGEADAQRRLKAELRDLPAPPPSPALVHSLLTLSEPGEPTPPSPRSMPGMRPARPARFRRPAAAVAATAPPDNRPPARPTSGRHPARMRYAVASLVSLGAIALGTAFAAGGQRDSGEVPMITPPVDIYAVEHAVTFGGVPFAGRGSGGGLTPANPTLKP